MKTAVLTSHPIQYQAPIFRALNAAGLDFEVFFAHCPSAKDQAAAGFGVEFDWDVDLISGYKSSFLRNISKAPSTSSFWGCDTPDLHLRLQSGNFDCLVAMGWSLKTYWQGALAARKCGMPLVVRGDSHLETPRPFFKTQAKRLIYPPALKLCDAALYVGQKSKRYFMHYGVKEERLFFCPHSVDPILFNTSGRRDNRAVVRKQYSIPSDALVLLFAGKLISEKRPLDVIYAANWLKAKGKDAWVMIVGAGILEGALRAQGRACGIEVVFLGFKNQSEMPRVFHAADVTCLPSESETWGIVVNESIACGTPVAVSSAVGCGPDLASGYSGGIFPVGDYRRLAQVTESIWAAGHSPESVSSSCLQYSLAGSRDGFLRALAWVRKLRPTRINRKRSTVK